MNRKIASKKQNLEHNGILQESFKSRDAGRDLFLLVRGDHCVGDWLTTCLSPWIAHKCRRFVQVVQATPCGHRPRQIILFVFLLMMC